MKRLVDKLVINDYRLFNDIVTALEKEPTSGIKYEIEMEINQDFDPTRNKPLDREVYCLKIFAIESMS